MGRLSAAQHAFLRDQPGGLWSGSGVVPRLQYIFAFGQRRTPLGPPSHVVLAAGGRVGGGPVLVSSGSNRKRGLDLSAFGAPLRARLPRRFDRVGTRAGASSLDAGVTGLLWTGAPFERDGSAFAARPPRPA